MKNILFILFSILFITFPITCYGFVVAIDVGHAGYGNGTISASGVPEVTYNKEVATGLKENLEARGFECFLIDGILLKERPFIANSKASILVSIHHDSVVYNPKTAYRFLGFSIFIDRSKGKWNNQYKKSFQLARNIGRQMVYQNFPVATYQEGNKRRGYKWEDKEDGIYSTDKLFILKESKIPAVLIECGVISNPEEEKFLSDPEGRKRLIHAIAQGIRY